MAETPTKIGLDAVSSIEVTGHPANILTGIVLRLLREHFASRPDIEYNGVSIPGWDLTKYIWNQDNTKTGIQIQPVWLWNAQDIARRPGIYVKRNGIQVIKFAINHGTTVGAERASDNHIVEVRGDYKSALLEGSHSIIVVSSSPDEVEVLGQEVFNHLLEFGPEIRTDFKLNLWEMKEFSELAKLEESSEHFAASITVQWRCFNTWRIKGLGPWLKTLEIHGTPV